MNKRLFFSVLATVAIALLLLGAGGFYEILATGPVALLRGQTVTRADAAMFVPKQAPMMVSLLVNVEELENVARLSASPSQRKQVRSEFNKIENSFLVNTDLNYHNDIEPWIGDEISFAVTASDYDRDRANSRQAGYLLAVETKDPQRSRDFLEVLWTSRANAGMEIVTENYQGVKLVYSNQTLMGDPLSPLSGTWASAVVGDRFVLFANHPKVLRDAINNVQAPNLSLISNRAYQRAIASLPSGKIGLTFVNLERFAAWISDRDSIPTNFNPTGERYLTAKVSPSLAIALGLNRQGLLAQTVWDSATDRTIAVNLPTLSQPVAALQYLPSEATLAIASTQLDELWRELSERFVEDEAIGQILRQPIAALQSQSGVNLPEDIFSWMQGEYAIGLLPKASPTEKDKSEFDWVFAVERTGENAATGIENIDAIAQQQGYSVGPVSLGDRSVSAWTKLTTTAQTAAPVRIAAEVRGVHTTVGNYEIFASSIETIDRAIAAATTGSLLTSEKFHDAIAPLPASNYGYFYVDWLTAQNSLDRRLPLFKLVRLAGKPLFARLRSLAIASPATPVETETEIVQNSDRLADIFLRLGS